MKKPIRLIFTNILVLWLLTGLFSSVHYDSFLYLVIASLILSAMQLLVLPVLKLLFMPITLLSFGTLSWLPTVAMFGFFAWIDFGYHLNTITIPKISYNNFSTPVFSFGVIGSVLLFTITYSLINKFLYWILK